MKLFIPEIGNRLILTKDWEFTLYWEYRNSKMLDKLGKEFSFHSKAKNYNVVIPAGTILGVDRIYIRKGVSNFSSVTFTIPKVENKKNSLSGTRFWASLSDVNKIEFELLTCNEDTLSNLRKINDDLKKLIVEPQQHSYFMKVLLNGKTLNMIRPQEDINTYLREANNRLSEIKVASHMKENFKKVHEYLGLEYRKVKLINAF